MGFWSKDGDILVAKEHEAKGSEGEEPVLGEESSKSCAGPAPWNDSAHSKNGITELRVHGVGGTTPEEMLFDPLPVKVAGDDTAGFWRTADREGRHVEAYSWGGLTSRSASRALWLLLLPFSLANVAGWTQRRMPDRDRKPGMQDPRGGRQGMLLLILGYALTLQVVVGVTSIALDIFAYQCGGEMTCRDHSHWTWVFGRSGLPTHPGQRLVLGAFVPLAVLGVIWWLGRGTRIHYEAVPTPKDVAWPRGADDAGQLRDGSELAVLLRPSTWNQTQALAGHQRRHLAAGVATVSGMVTLASAALAHKGHRSATFGLGLSVTALLLVILVVATKDAIKPVTTRTDASEPHDFKGARQSAILLGASLLVLISAFAWAWRLPLTQASDPKAMLGTLPGISRTGEGLFAVQIALIGILFLSGSRSEATPGEPQAFRWCCPALMSTLAVFLAGSVIGGSMLRVADFLGKAAKFRTPPLIVTPFSYDWLAILLFVAVVSVATVVLIYGIFFLLVRPSTPKGREAVREVLSRYAGVGEADGRCASSVERAEHLVQVIRRLDRPLSLVVFLGLALAAASYLARFRVQGGPDLIAYGRYLPMRYYSPLRTASSWVVTALPAAGVGLMIQAYRTRGRRKTVGILWDVFAFWPRWFHPLAPPCYAERAIPELQYRVLELTQPSGRVVVSAHSQGTVTSTVALGMLPDANLERIAYVTYGSALSYLQPLLFPDHFPETTVHLASRLSEAPAKAGLTPWRNLWRRTDPIGGSVPASMDPEDCIPLCDPVPPLSWCQICSPVAGHSHYLEDPAYVAHIAALTPALRTQLP